MKYVRRETCMNPDCVRPQWLRKLCKALECSRPYLPVFLCVCLVRRSRAIAR